MLSKSGSQIQEPLTQSKQLSCFVGEMVFFKVQLYLQTNWSAMIKYCDKGLVRQLLAPRYGPLVNCIICLRQNILLQTHKNCYSVILKVELYVLSMSWKAW